MAVSTKKTMTLLGVALGLGAIGAFLAMLYLNARESALRDLLRPDSQPIEVVVAGRDLLKGDVLDGNTLSVRKIPSNFVNDNAVFPSQFDAISGQVLQQNLSSGKMLLHSFIDQDFPLDFSDTLVIKRRAMTIQVDEMSTFTGLLRPGNRVDLLVHTTLDGSNKKTVVPVLENVEVLTTGRDSAVDYTEKVRFLRGGVDVSIEQNFSTITLNVTPKEAALLAIARESGELLALLRNRKDHSGSGYSSMSSDQIRTNALQLARKEKIRQSSEQLSQQVVMGQDGIIRNAQGVALASQNLVIGADGSIRTKSGIDLTKRGLSINAKGQIVNKDGQVIDVDALTITADGTVMTKDGLVLGGAKVKRLNGLQQLDDGTVVMADGTIISGVTLDPQGNLILANGQIIDPNNLIVTADGSVVDATGQVVAQTSNAKSLTGLTTNAQGEVVTADGRVIKGATLNEDGNLVLANGEVINPDQLVIAADGSISYKDQPKLAGVINEQGDLVLADGTIVKAEDFTIAADGSISYKDQPKLAGVINGQGDLVLADGTIVKADDFTIAADGTYSRKNQSVLAGLTSTVLEPSDSQGVTSDIELENVSRTIDYIAGGVSKDGIAEVKKLIIETKVKAQ